MADKRISQLTDRGTVANSDVVPIVVSGASTTNKATISSIQTFMQGNLDLGVTSVGLSMPSAFTVTGSPVTSSGNISVAGAGTVSQYIRGDGSLADFPSISGGGSSVSYYLNGSVSQGTIGGIAYTEMNKVPILGAGTDFTINADGYIASFITDAGDPALLQIPAGNWNFETFLQASSAGGSPSFYIELYKVDSGGTATLIASNSASPELISLGTSIHAYFSALAVPTTTLALTDRLALRYYVTHSGRTITLHTENNTLCQIITTFTTGLTALNGLTAQVQNFATGTSGTDFGISSATSTHTFNLPTASATNRGALSSADWTIFNNKQNALINPITGTGASGQVAFWNGTNTQTGDNGLFWDNTNKRLGVGTNTPSQALDVVGNARILNNVNFPQLILGRTTTRNSALTWDDPAGEALFQTHARLYPFVFDASHIRFMSSGVTRMRIFETTGNLLLQNGGTFTDAGFRLDVNGSTRFNGLSTIQGTTASDSGQLGAELLTTGTGDASWTGTSFATGYTHVAGSTTTLTSTLAGVVNTFYQITYTVTGRTAGSFTIGFGGFTSAALTATGAVGPRATTTGTLVITPTTDFDGTIVLSIRVITASSASVTFNNSAGTATNQIRISSLDSNTFIGLNAGRTTTTGTNNSFYGRDCGVNNTTGNSNSFFGRGAGNFNTTGVSNAFFGASAGLANTTGSNNSFVGASAGAANTTGTNNAFFGNGAGQGNTTGASNSFFGVSAGLSNTTASSNSFFGENAGFANITGANNIAFGRNAGRFAGSGTTAMTSVNNSIYLGFQTRGLNATGSTNEVVIGYDVVGLGSNTTVLGNTSTTHGRWYGNLLIGTDTNSTFLLDVNGTARVTGAATFSSSVTATANASGRSGLFGGASFGVRIDNSGSFNNGGSVIHGVDNTFVASYQKLSLNGSSLEFMTDYGTKLTIANSGAATFSSSVTSLAAAGATFFSATTTGGSDVRITSGASAGFVGTTSNHSLSFVTNNNVVATIGTDAAVNFGGSVLALGITSSASVAFPHTTKSANYTLNANDYTVGFDCSSNRTATLPDATTCAGRIYVIYQYNTGLGLRSVTLDGNGSQTINGDTTYNLSPYCDFSSVMIQSNGSNWIIISSNLTAGCL
jgi:hypothetical protein